MRMIYMYYKKLKQYITKASANGAAKKLQSQDSLKTAGSAASSQIGGPGGRSQSVGSYGSVGAMTVSSDQQLTNQSRGQSAYSSGSRGGGSAISDSTNPNPQEEDEEEDKVATVVNEGK